MERDNYHQLDFFPERGNYSKGLIQKKPPFFNYIRTYENILLALIGFVVTGIIAFSLGVEKGKVLSSGGLLVLKSGPQLAVEKENIIKSESSNRYKLDSYTIQIASYLDKTSAQREFERLRNKGLFPILLSKGKYTVVCVGNFPDKGKALASLLEIKKQKRYQDSFIRRL